MLCPVCQGGTKVLDSRDGRERSVRRRRRCTQCGHRFSTRERIEAALPMVTKRDGSREAFDSSKLLRGLSTACRKRPVPEELLQQITAEIEQWAATQGEKEIPAEQIGARVMHRLYRLDPVAYVRFVSVYRSFDSIQAFADLLTQMQKAEEVDAEGQRHLFDSKAASAAKRGKAAPPEEDSNA